MNFQKLREKHKKFIYESFEILHEKENLKIYFNFTILPDLHFRPEIVLPNASKVKDIDGLVFNLGMVELLSYWKAACPPEIVIKAGHLNKEQINFWKKLLIKGLGEFFYTNKIDFTKSDLVKIKIETRSHSSSGKLFDGQLKDGDLVLVGGGKDSAVTLETISQSKRQFNCLLLNPTNAAINISKAAGCKNSIIIKRTIDPKLLELNKKGYLNGHTPFSAYLAFMSIVVAHLYNYKNIIVSNEASSDEANIKWHGMLINHQYSKTKEFEKDFKKYSKKYLSKSVNYFSFLRKKGELEIAEIFSKMPKYHYLFKSCNKGSKTDSWCGKCPKCLSTYITLYPFLGGDTQKIFWKNLLDDKSFLPIVKGLMGQNNKFKPFECVATYDEIKTAIALGLERDIKEGREIPKLLRSFKSET